ncbi:unnamed protein product, partial [Mesorhabditis belari]|uniref:Reverse transcriptase n=1 Tax=Mesorhabditis belari TaxID=2138241 RepID=A0AAF3EWD8_9BILA
MPEVDAENLPPTGKATVTRRFAQKCMNPKRYRPIDPDRVGVNGSPAEMTNGNGCVQNGVSDHLQWESVKERVIKAGTVEKLVDPKDAGSFRPIAILNTQFKLLTGVIARVITEKYNGNRYAFPEEQLAVRTGVKGCETAHLTEIDTH